MQPAGARRKNRIARPSLPLADPSGQAKLEVVQRPICLNDSPDFGHHLHRHIQGITRLCFARAITAVSDLVAQHIALLVPAPRLPSLGRRVDRGLEHRRNVTAHTILERRRTAIAVVTPFGDVLDADGSILAGVWSDGRWQRTAELLRASPVGPALIR